jgi:hypothetical protein
MTVKAIPTKYRGVNFRSRLEAKWAIVFDELGWRWDYEPIDLAGYIPDFILSLAGGHMLVEVKPALSIEELHDATPKIMASGWNKEALVVGARLFPEHDAIGLLQERMGCEDDKTLEPWWEPAWVFRCGMHNGIGFCHSIGLYTCRVCGDGDGDHHLGMNETQDLEIAWDIATNATQYRNKRR